MPASITPPCDETLIRETINRRANAIRDKSPEAVRAAFSSDTAGYFIDPPLQQSIQQEDLEGWFATWSGPIGYEFAEPKISVGGDIAYAHYLSHLTGLRTDGDDTDVWLRETLCFRRLDQRWLIAHLHESVPMLMDGSNKAATDLKPD